ncbi:MAG: transcriptional regulator [Clostridia bacterium]|nr:transcriptional regulator [Clostridia bacterium]
MDYSNNLGYLVNKAARMTKWDLNHSLAELGITSTQWGLIRDICINEKMCGNDEERLLKLTPAAIAERLRADRPTVSCMVEKLVKQGWAYRISNPKDGRSQIILLTDKAKGLIPKLEHLSESTLEKATKGFGENEVEQLKQYLMRMIENLDS